MEGKRGRRGSSGLAWGNAAFCRLHLSVRPEIGATAAYRSHDETKIGHVAALYFPSHVTMNTKVEVAENSLGPSPFSVQARKHTQTYIRLERGEGRVAGWQIPASERAATSDAAAPPLKRGRLLHARMLALNAPGQGLQ